MADKKTDKKEPEKTEEVKAPSFDEIKYGFLAGYLAKQNPELVPYAISALGRDLKTEPRAQGLLETIVKQGDGIQSVLKYFPEAYETEFNKASLGNIVNYFAPTLKYASDEDKKTIQEALGGEKVSGLTIENIAKKSKYLKTQIDANEQNLLAKPLEEKEIEAIKKSLAQYSMMGKSLETIKEIYLDELTQKIKPDFYKDQYKVIAEGLNTVYKK